MYYEISDIHASYIYLFLCKYSTKVNYIFTCSLLKYQAIYKKTLLKRQPQHFNCTSNIKTYRVSGKADQVFIKAFIQPFVTLYRLSKGQITAFHQVLPAISQCDAIFDPPVLGLSLTTDRTVKCNISITVYLLLLLISRRQLGRVCGCKGSY